MAKQVRDEEQQFFERERFRGEDDWPTFGAKLKKELEQFDE